MCVERRCVYLVSKEAHRHEQKLWKEDKTKWIRDVTQDGDVQKIQDRILLVLVSGTIILILLVAGDVKGESHG